MKVSCICMGGLGNILFQIANLLSYSLKYDVPYCVPTVIDNPHNQNQKMFYSPYLNYCEKEKSGIKCFYNESSFTYTEIPKINCVNAILKGYYQSYLYTEPYKDEIIKLLDIPIEYNRGWVFLHNRLGDYKTLTNFHSMISDDYINRTVLYFKTRGYRNFLVVSDGVDETREKINSLKQTGVYFKYSEGKTDVEDLSLMASCQHGIMSASSFSWWGAWLGSNEDRTIFYPKNWFGAEVGHDIKDLCPPNWIAT